MQFHIITLFPEVVLPYLNSSILKRARDKKLVDVFVHNPRDFTTDPSTSLLRQNPLDEARGKSGQVGASKRKTVDDRPYGGGPGMVMKAEPILKAVERALRKPARGGSASSGKEKVKILIMSPRGRQLTNEYAQKLAKNYKSIVLISGHYEGIDARVKKILKAEEVSTGPYVLTGGELPALTLIDAVTRRIPGVLGKDESLEERRVASRDVYTRPEVLDYKGKKHKVPHVLLSGDHKKIGNWRGSRG